MDNRKITDLPEHTRRKILWVSVGAITIVIFTAWLWWLPQSIGSITPAPSNQTGGDGLKEIQQQLRDLLDTTSQQLDQPADANEQPSEAEIIQAMKDKLNQQQATTTPTSTATN